MTTYFAYGSNMNPGQMIDRCPETRTLGVARLVDYRLTFPRFSSTRQCASAGIEPYRGSAVWGVLYEVSKADLHILHHLEGFDPEGPVERNRHLFREVTVLRMGGSEPVRAMTYFAVPDGTSARPSRAYLQLLIDGAEYHGLPLAYIAALNAIRAA
jgi:hypothetical protein